MATRSPRDSGRDAAQRNARGGRTQRDPQRTPERANERSARRAPHRPPRTVPVASRDAARAKARAKKPRRMEMLKGDIVGVAVLITVVLIVLIAIAVPLRNYYSGREEIARLEASIESKKQQKTELEEKIDRYNDPAYVEQEARRRLGMMAPGETAWRIIDPRMQSDAITTSRGDEIDPDTPWHTVIWDSLREIPEKQPETEGAPEEPPAPAPEEPPAEPAEAPVEQ